MPQITVIHTSRTFHGQLYIPVANWLMMIGTIMVASIFNNVSLLSLLFLRIPVYLLLLDNFSRQRVRGVRHVCYIL